MIRSRIAPTPSGYLHIGNALNFVLTWLLARNNGGKLLLRIDDLDSSRVREEYIEDIFRTLEWLGIDWDEGPESIDEHYNTYSQRYRIDSYDNLLIRLIETEKVFACTCSRKDILDQGNDHQYTSICRNKGLSLNTPDSALRLLIPESTIINVRDTINPTKGITLYDVIRDPIVRRRDGIPAYHIVSLADDINHNINLIVRGEDLLPSTALQIYISQLTGGISFVNSYFHHHHLIAEENGQKLSKSTGSTSIRQLREHESDPGKFYLWLTGQLKLPLASSAQEALKNIAEYQNFNLSIPISPDNQGQ